jgi:hypothetical protein
MWNKTNTDIVATLTYKRIRVDLAAMAVTAQAATAAMSLRTAEMEETEENLA